MAIYNKVLPIILLIIVICVLSLNHIYFALNDLRPSIEHDLEYSEFSTDIHYFLLAKYYNEPLKYSHHILEVKNNQITLLEKYIGLFLFIFAKNFFYFRLSLLAPLILFLLSLYLLGTALINRWAGILLVALLFSLPGVISHSRSCWPQLYATSFIFLSIVFLIKSQNFTQRKYTLLFAVSLGISTSIHYSAILYTIIIYAWLSLTIFKLKKETIYVSIIMLSIIALVIIFPLYLIALKIFSLLAVLILLRHKKTITNFTLSFLTLFLVSPLYSYLRFIVQIKNTTPQLIIGSPETFIDYINIIMSHLLLKSCFLDSFYFYFILSLFTLALFNLAYLKQKKTIYFPGQKHIESLFLILIFQSSLTIFWGKSDHANILSFSLACALIVSFFSRINKYKLISYCLVLIITSHLILSNCLAGYIYGLNYTAEALVVDNSNWARKDVKKFLKENQTDQLLKIGLLEPCFAFYFYNYYPLDKLTLSLLSGKQPLKIIYIKNEEQLNNVLKNKIVDFLIFEEHHRQNLDQEKIKNTLLKSDYSAYKKFSCQNKSKTIYLLKSNNLS